MNFRGKKGDTVHIPVPARGAADAAARHLGQRRNDVFALRRKRQKLTAVDVDRRDAPGNEHIGLILIYRDRFGRNITGSA